MNVTATSDRLRTRVGGLLQVGGLRRATVLTALGSGLARVVGLPATLLGAAALGSHAYGAFAFLVTTASLLSSLGVLGFGPITTQAVARSDRSGNVATTAVSLVAGLLVTWCAIFAAVVGLVDLGPVLPGYRLLESAAAITAVSLLTVGSGVSTVVAAILVGHKQFGVASKLTVVRAAVVGYVTLAAAMGTGSATSAALASGAAEVLVAAAGLVLLARRGWCRSVQLRELPAYGATMTRAAVPAGVASLTIQGGIWATQLLLLARVDGSAENGGFALATRLGLLVSFVPAALAVSSVSYVASQPDPERARALAYRVVKVGMALSLVGAVALGVLAPYVTGLFGASYARFASTTAIMAVAGLGVSLNALLSNAAVGLHIIPAWVASDVMLAVIMVGAGVLLIRSTGANGAAVATALAYGGSGVFLGAAMRRNVRTAT